jgi:hypothetical protein
LATFSKLQDRELRKLLKRLPISQREKTAESFLLSYIGFESVSRKIWQYYRCRKMTKSESHSGIPLPELKKAFNYFQISVTDSVLTGLLSSTLDKRNSKSARNLRNAIAHSWKQPDCDEAIHRFSEFKQHFTHVINSVQITMDS